MRCVALSLTNTFELAVIAREMRGRGFTMDLDKNVLTLYSALMSETHFIFSNGCVVLWNMRSNRERWFLPLLQSLIPEEERHYARDEFVYNLGTEVRMVSHQRYPVDMIYLNDLNNDELKLAISFGLAQSIKLNTHERAIQAVVSRSDSLPRELAHRGKIALSRKAILKRIGEIYLAKNSVNFSRDQIGIPEFFWRYPNIEHHYIMVEKFMDIPERMNWLNEKLDMLNDLLSILTSHLEYRQSNLIEIVIVLLIFTELVVSVFHFSF